LLIKSWFGAYSALVWCLLSLGVFVLVKSWFGAHSVSWVLSFWCPCCNLFHFVCFSYRSAQTLGLCSKCYKGKMQPQPHLGCSIPVLSWIDLFIPLD